MSSSLSDKVPRWQTEQDIPPHNLIMVETGVTLGWLAAISSSFFMTVGFIIYGEDWKGSPFQLNLYKCSLASALFLIVAYFSTSASTSSWGSVDVSMLLFSSFIGIVIGDITWLKALSMIGARRVIVVDSIKPFLASILGSIFLNEALHVFTFVGMMFTVFGILVVSLEQGNDDKGGSTEDNSIHEAGNVQLNVLHTDGDLQSQESSKEQSSNAVEKVSMVDSENTNGDQNKVLHRGYMLAAVNVFLDAIGSLLTKMFGVTMSPFEINLIRFGFAAICLVVMLYIVYIFEIVSLQQSRGSFGRVRSEDLTDESADCEEKNHGDITFFFIPKRDIIKFPVMTTFQWHKVALGVLFVTFTCPSLSNYALFQIDLGTCLTLTSLGPLFSIPLVYLMKGEIVSWRAIIGAILSVTGIMMMSFTSNSS